MMSGELPKKDSEKIKVYYDGECPVCSGVSDYFGEKDSGGEIEWCDLNSARGELEELGISRKDALKELHAVDSEGRITKGVGALANIWGKFPGWRIFARATGIPGISGLMSFGYRIFANNRTRKPSATRETK